MSNTSSPASCTRRFSPASTLRMPIWRTARAGGWPARVPAICTVKRFGAVAAQAGHGHAVQVAAGRELAGVEVGVGVEPQHTQPAAGAAGNGAPRRLMLPTARQWSPPSRMGKPRPAAVRPARRRARPGSRPPPGPGGGSRPSAGSQGLAGPLRLPRSATSRPCACRARCRPATRKASGPMLAPRAPAPMSVGAPIRLI
jgi:hypothetical protein